MTFPGIMNAANTLLSLILMHGISMSLWRSILNTTMPTNEINIHSSNPHIPRFSFSLSNRMGSKESKSQANYTETTLNSKLINSEEIEKLKNNNMRILPIYGLGQILVVPVETKTHAPTLREILPLASQASDQNLILDKLGKETTLFPNNNQFNGILLNAALVPPIHPIVKVTIHDAFTGTNSISSSKYNMPSLLIQSAQASTLNPIKPTSSPMNDYINKILMQNKLSSSTYSDSYSKQNVDISEDVLKILGKLNASKNNNTINNFKRLCYYLFSSDEKSELDPDNIDPFLCTHIVISFVEIGVDGMVNFGDPQDVIKLRKITRMRQKNENLSIYLSLGQKEDNQFEKLMKVSETREKIISSWIELIRLYNLNGGDLFWVFENDQKIPETYILIDIIKTLSSSINVSLSINCLFKDDISLVYDSVKILSLLCVDLDVNEKIPMAKHPTPLFSTEEDKSVSYCIKKWLQRRIPYSIAAITIPIYGVSFNLPYPFGGYNIPALGKGISQGILNYTQVCEFLSFGTTNKWNNNGNVPYAYKGFDWIAYENIESMKAKINYIHRFALSPGIYTINWDDQGQCGIKWRLSKMMKEI